MLLFSAINKDLDCRMNSTSGGLFSAIAEYVISQNGIVYGAAYVNQNKVCHIAINSSSELCLLRGAKYVESSLKGVFPKVKQQLEDNKFVLFSGTPCQIGSLRKYLKKDYENLLLIDVVCHGTPTRLAWDSYIYYRMKQDKQTALASKINLRCKESGWSLYNYSVSFTYPSGYRYLCLSKNDHYMIAFLNNLILKESCYHCRYKGFERSSDFTLGDFWGVWDIKPHMDDNKGTSLVMIHTKKGENIWKKIQKDIYYEPLTQEQACKQNPSIMVSSPKPKGRDVLMTGLRTKDWECVEKRVRIIIIKNRIKSRCRFIYLGIKHWITSIC